MNIFKKVILYFFIINFFSGYLFSKEVKEFTQTNIQSLSQNIAQTSTIFLTNFAIDELENKIKLDMKNQNIKAIVIEDLYLKENILIAYKDHNNKIHLKDTLPKKYTKFKSIKQDIIDIKEYSSTTIGILTLYYEENPTQDTKIDILSNLNYEEKQYLKHKKSLSLCIDPSWMPFERIQDNKHIGITADYIKIFSKELDIPINLIQTSSWVHTLQKAKNRECDILSLVSPTKARKEYMNFTSPYINTPIVMATRIGIPFIDNIEKIQHRRLGIVGGYSLNKILKKEYPNINLIEVDSVEDGLKKVKKGILFAYLDNTIVINYAIQKDFIGTLTVSGKLENNIKLGIGTRNDEKLLHTIFEKLVLSIDKKQKQKIINKWVKVNYTIKTDYTVVWYFTLILLLIISGTIYWNRKLSNLNKQLEIERDRAKDATKSKSEFLANMSHEIRTPMNGIIGMSSLALQGNIDNKSKNYIQKIDYSAKSLLNIINDILDFSKIEAGKLKIEKVDFNLNQIINSAINIVEYKANEKELDLIVNYNINNDDIVYADPLRLSQVLVNLLSNGIKFTNKGSITLTIKHLTHYTYQFEIKDTGIGLKKDKIDTLFQSFNQADGSTTRKYGGTGLGLSISKQLVELMNGNIWVESKEGKGSNFVFTIELLPKQSSSSNHPLGIKEPSYNTSILKDSNILLVEDNTINQEIVLGLLENSGINIDIAVNGKEAIDLFNKKRKKYKLILMDIQMPIMGGLEATELLRKIDKNIPIIALTANAMIEDIQESKRVGMNEHLSKPIDVNKLLSVLVKYIHNDSVSEVGYTTTKDEEYGSQYINTVLGISYFNNNKELYSNILSKFYTQYKDLDITSLTQEQKTRTLHTLKGLSGNIGAENLHKLSKELENSNDKNLILTFQEELNNILSELNQLNIFSKSQNNSKMQLSEDLKEELLLNLKEAILSKRPNNINPIIEDLDKYFLNIENQKTFDTIKENISKYKYKESITLIDSMVL